MTEETSVSDRIPERPQSPASSASSSDWAPRTSISPVAAMVRRMIEENIDPRNFCERIGLDVPDGYDQVDIFRMLMRCLGGVRERRKRRQKYDLAGTIQLIKEAKKILVLTGAGISVSCGIPDFRSRNGLYAKLAVDFPELPDPQSMFCLRFFRRDPRPFFRFAKEIFPGNFEPSPSHKFIAQLEKSQKLKRLYSQNIDGLEQQAGIEKVVQCHGHMHTAHCLECNAEFKIEELRKDIFAKSVPSCPKERQVDMCRDGIDLSTPPDSKVECMGIIKPDIVFFGESLPKHFHRHMTDDKDDVDLLIVMGSSLKVGPVNDIPDAIGDDVPRILINREPLPHISEFESELLGNCDEIVSYISQQLGYTLPGVSNDEKFNESNWDKKVEITVAEFNKKQEEELAKRKENEEAEQKQTCEEKPPSPKKPKLDDQTPESIGSSEKKTETEKSENVSEEQEKVEAKPDDAEKLENSDCESDDGPDPENIPIITVDEKCWIAHPCGYRTLFHGVEMPLIEDESSDDENDNENDNENDENPSQESEVQETESQEEKNGDSEIPSEEPSTS